MPWAVPLAAISPAGHAQDAPSGPVVLSIYGRGVSRPNRSDFDMSMLERLPQRTIVTTTPWYPQAKRFTGPLMRDLLIAAGAAVNSSGSARCIALNDYKVDIPLEDVRTLDVIVARLLDDKPMSVREKGPLFVMYPFDEKPALRTNTYFARCIWQLRAIELA